MPSVRTWCSFCSKWVSSHCSSFVRNCCFFANFLQQLICLCQPQGVLFPRWRWTPLPDLQTWPRIFLFLNFPSQRRFPWKAPGSTLQGFWAVYKLFFLTHLLWCRSSNQVCRLKLCICQATNPVGTSVQSCSFQFLRKSLWYTYFLGKDCFRNTQAFL